MAFLVDGDDGGRTHKKNLKAAGIPEKRILDLSLLGSDNVTPEDCVKVDLLVDAANAEGEPFWTDKTLTAADLPETGRSHAIELWCDERSLPRPSKVRMAQRLLELAPSDDADPATRPALLTTEECTGCATCTMLRWKRWNSSPNDFATHRPRVDDAVTLRKELLRPPGRRFSVAEVAVSFVFERVRLSEQ